MTNRTDEIDLLVSAAVDLDSPEERMAYIRANCGGNDALRLEVEGRVDAYFRAGDFLESPPVELTAAHELDTVEAPGATIGRYKLIERIGEGGFGSVYLAEQVEPVRRRVALKIIKLGLDTRKVVARFEAERQALAMMEHPGIAKVLDAGATETGRPYFVMELVRGAPITTYCDAHRLSIRERLVLFEQICQAVQHAHQKGIVHRDLKPTNVLVSSEGGQPVAKVIDFGVAKAIEGRLTEKTIFTEHQQLIGTPAYMSPEQADGTLDVDTRSDVYSLGVLLYELLTGAPPFDPQELRSKAFAEMQRIIREVDPPTPSARLIEVAKTTTTNQGEPEPSNHNALAQIAGNRGIDPRRLSASLHGELDWIAMRCLEKDRARRYQTANNLAEDVQRYLNDLPVEARPPTPIYRLGKFVRRNKVSVLAGSAIFVGLIVGVALLSWMFVREREARRRATTAGAKSEQVATFLKEMLAAAGPSVAQGRDATLLHEILKKTSQRVNAELGDQPEVRGDLFYTLGETYQDIGDYANAVPSFQQAVASYRVAGDEYRSKLALSLARLGRCQSFNKDVASGKKNAKLGLEIVREFDDPEVLATCLLSVASSFDLYGMGSAEGTPYVREAVEIRKRLGNNSKDFADNLRLLASVSKDRTERESLCRQALDLDRKQLGSDHPKVASDLFSLGQMLMNSGKYEQAEPFLRETVDLYRKIYPAGHPYQVIVVRILAENLIREEKWADAEALLVEAVHKNPTMIEYNTDLGSFKAYQGKWSEAADQLRSSNGDWHAIALVRAGRVEDYRRSRKAGKPGPPPLDIESRLNCAKKLLLLPSDGDVLERAYIVADIDPTSVSVKRYVDWLDVVKALAEYRRDNFEVAFELADRAVSRKDDTHLSRQAQGWCIRALACTKLGKIDEGRASLASAEKLIKRPDRDRGTDFLFHWPDWAVAEILGREAAELLDQSSRDQTGDAKPAADQASPAKTSK